MKRSLKKIKKNINKENKIIEDENKQKTLIFVCVVLNFLLIANRKKSAFSASIAKAELTKIALGASFYMSIRIIPEIKT